MKAEPSLRQGFALQETSPGGGGIPRHCVAGSCWSGSFEDGRAVDGLNLHPNARSSTVQRLLKGLIGLSLDLAREARELLDSEGPHARCENGRSTLELLPWNITVRKWFQNRSLEWPPEGACCRARHFLSPES